MSSSRSEGTTKLSWRATAYVKSLTENITPSEKLLLFVLSDYYNDHKQVAWPSIKELASESLMSERNCRRMLTSLEEKGILKRTIRHGLLTTLYEFCELNHAESQVDKLSTYEKSQVDKSDAQVDKSDVLSGHSCVPQNSRTVEQFNLTALQSDEPRLPKKKQKTTDGRHKRFMELIVSAHKHFVKVPPFIDGVTGVNLAKLLKARPDIDETKFKVMLKNYHNSDDHGRAENPRKYILSLPKYELSALDRFGIEPQVKGTGIGYATA